VTRRAIGIGWLAVAVLALAGCGGGNRADAGRKAVGGACEAAKADLLSTVAERDRLFVDLQLGKATAACEGDLASSGSVEKCTDARADLEAAAAEDTPPPDLDGRIDAAVESCVGTEITSTIPAP
jgi:hypothetical protein